MLLPSVSQLAALAADAACIVHLVELDFAGGTYYFSTFNVTRSFTSFGSATQRTYLGVGDLASVGDIKESQETDAQTVSITLSVVNQALLAACLGSVENYRGRRARIGLQLLDAQYRAIGRPLLRFAGDMEPVKIPRDAQPQGGGAVGGRIELPISRAGMSRARNADGLRLTHEQQQAEFPGDRGLEYVRGLIERPAQWLSKRFQQQ